MNFFFQKESLDSEIRLHRLHFTSFCAKDFEDYPNL